MNNLYYIFPVISGAILAIQLVVEAKNRDVFGSQPIAFMAFSTAALASLAWAWLAKKSPLPSLEQFISADWYLHFGGIARICYLAFIVMAMPKIGPGNTFSLAVVTQVITALIVSYFGWFGMPIQKMDASKIVGIIILITGVFLITNKK